MMVPLIFRCVIDVGHVYVDKAHVCIIMFIIIVNILYIRVCDTHILHHFLMRT